MSQMPRRDSVMRMSFSNSNMLLNNNNNNPSSPTTLVSSASSSSEMYTTPNAVPPVMEVEPVFNAVDNNTDLDNTYLVKTRLSAGEKAKKFLRKYFLQGQNLEESYMKAVAELRPDDPWTKVVMVKYRKYIGFLIPVVFFHVFWWILAIKWNFFKLYPTHYAMPITMFFGSSVAGATSEGGGSVAFPVMTLALGLHAAVARDFSLMIQSFGMTAATFSILWMKLKLEWYSIVFTNLGGFFGIIFGFEVIDPLLDSNQRKLGFVSIWFSFAVSLAILNRHKRITYDRIPDFNWWKFLVLVVIGFIGGILSALCGVGLDIASFSVLCLLFRVSEKVATPTSIVLMATNTVVGFFWRQFMTETGCEKVAWEYLSVTIPVAVVMAPVGALLASFCHRQVFAFFVYIGDTIALITAYCVLPMNWQLAVESLSLLLGCFVFFLALSKLGDALLHHRDKEEMEKIRHMVNSNSRISSNNNNNQPRWSRNSVGLFVQ